LTTVSGYDSSKNVEKINISKVKTNSGLYYLEVVKTMRFK